jgi:hypothetical protein
MTIVPMVLRVEALSKLLGLPGGVEVVGVVAKGNRQVELTLVDQDGVLAEQFDIDIVRPAELKFTETDGKGKTRAESQVSPSP